MKNIINISVNQLQPSVAIDQDPDRLEANCVYMLS